MKTLSLVGIEPFLNKLRQLGMKGLNESGDYYGPSLALGSADVSLWELTNAYRTLANEGTWDELRLISERKRFNPEGRRYFQRRQPFSSQISCLTEKPEALLSASKIPCPPVSGQQ